MKYVTKTNLSQIKIDEINENLPDLKNIKESKAVTIGKWLTNVIENNKSVKPNSLLPAKPDLAYMLGVSIGTIQNALRYIEDLGYVESKQCIGTIIRDRNNNEKIRKLTSKRELAIEEIKRYIKNSGYSKGSVLPSTRNISKAINSSQNTTRLALESLGTAGILEHKFKNSDETGWVVSSLDFSINNIEQENNTLVKKVENDLKSYISDNLKKGDKIPAHSTLSQKLSVSIKTIHDALKALIDEGVLLARRGRYGTTVLKMPNESDAGVKKETSIFASAPETAFYYYEKTQNNIKRMISENYEIGQKLPSVMELSRQMDLSPNTIRKAFHNLAKEGYLAFSRGRYGGTFVIDIPETEEQAYKWLAVNHSYTDTYEN